MRKIDQAMLAALRSGRNWSGGNTRVCFQPNPSIEVDGVEIAYTEKTGRLVARWDSSPSVTVRRRLDALGLNPTPPHLRMMGYSDRGISPR